MMTKRSRFERQRRADETANVRELEQGWIARIPAPERAALEEAVLASRALGPRPKPADMAPGTAPRPPRPGHEPKPPKVDATARRRR